MWLPHVIVSEGFDMQSAFNSSVFAKVAQAVAQAMYVEISCLLQTTRLTDDLALGKLGRLKLAIVLEEAFDIEFQDDAVERFNTLGDIVNHLSYRYFRDVEPAAIHVAA